MRRICLAVGLFSVVACKSTGQIDAVTLRASDSVPRVHIGLIESRDLGTAHHASSDMADLFTFELQKLGYQVQPLDTRQLESGEKTDGKKQQADDTSDLMPEYMRGLAGEIRPRPGDAYRDRFLGSEEIKKVAARANFTYFVQGSLSRSEAGDLLEPDQSYLVLLTAYDAQGQKAGALTFTVKNTSLSEATFMKEVCARMARTFDQTIHKRQPAQRNWMESVREMLVF